MGENKELYLNFDEYIRQGEPQQKERAEAWSVAIGLQAVDGLKTSEYLQQTARRNIEGEITIDEVRELVNQYYVTKTAHDADDEDKEEADRVSSNIVKVLSSPTFDFSTGGYQSVHRRVFEGVMKHAGELRTYDITKKEWVLEGDTVLYLNWEDLRRAIDYDLEQERQFSYKGKSQDEMMSVQPNLAGSTSTRQAGDKPPDKQPDKFDTNNQYINNLIKLVGSKEMSIKEMLTGLGLKDRESFMNVYLNPAIKEKYIRLLYPKSPRHPRQKYLLTVKGLALYNELIKEV